jgi:hypothetical protein
VYRVRGGRGDDRGLCACGRLARVAHVRGEHGRKCIGRGRRWVVVPLGRPGPRRGENGHVRRRYRGRIVVLGTEEAARAAYRVLSEQASERPSCKSIEEGPKAESWFETGCRRYFLVGQEKGFELGVGELEFARGVLNVHGCTTTTSCSTRAEREPNLCPN